MYLLRILQISYLLYIEISQLQNGNLCFSLYEDIRDDLEKDVREYLDWYFGK